MTDAVAADAVILVAGLLGLLFAAFQAWYVSNEKLPQVAASFGTSESKTEDPLVATSDENEKKIVHLHHITKLIADGANSFLFEEYKIMAVFIVVFGAIVLILVGSGAGDYTHGVFAALSFTTGSVTSILSGWIGMRIAVYTNVRTAWAAKDGFARAFRVAFRGGSVMGFSLTGLALLLLYALILLFNLKFDFQKDPQTLFDLIAGYGLGGSSIALFGRVGGGIYTKAADVGADLVGKVEKGIPEDDPRNPGVIADNVGDNVGDIAGMGADLFGSFAEASCAALVVISHSPDLSAHWGSLMFPLLISASGIMVCFVCSFLGTHLMVVHEEHQIERTLKMQLWATTLLMTPTLFLLARGFLPDGSFCVSHCGTAAAKNAHYYEAFVCVASGLWGGLIIGLITEYFTSHSYEPVKEVARATKTGHATNIIYGLALGYKSVIIPVFALALAVFFSFALCGMFGVALAALGMLSTLATGLTIDAYGPISDNAGGIVEMCEIGDDIRERTDALDAAGNTTAAIGKGFAIGSAALVSLALFGAFVTRSQADGALNDTSILTPITFAFLLIGAMLPYWFSALTMKSVGMAANKMVENIRLQFKDGQIMSGAREPDYDACVRISTDASLREMIAPGALVMLSPIIAGIFFGPQAVVGLLSGGLVSGVQMAISASNTGGAWDNAKKYIEAGKDADTALRKPGPCFDAAVTGDTVGDPLKDTSGPALNILMKLMAIISLVFADFFAHKSLDWGANTTS